LRTHTQTFTSSDNKGRLKLSAREPTDGQQAAANSRSYCVAVRSAKNERLINE